MIDVNVLVHAYREAAPEQNQRRQDWRRRSLRHFEPARSLIVPETQFM